MADDMNSNGEPARTYPPQEAMAALSERITNLNRRQTDNEAENRTAFRSMETTIDKLASEMRSGLANLATNLAERNKPQWQALGVALTFAGIIGGMAYLPIRESTADLKAQDAETARIIQSLATETTKSLQALAANTVSRQEMDWRAARGAEDRAQAVAAIAEIRAGLVPRTEHERVWQNYDQRFIDQQRQIDELKAASASTYNVRDVILDLRNRLDALERPRSP